MLRVYTSQRILAHIRLAKGYRKGDKVRSLIALSSDKRPLNICKGDVGFVKGPCPVEKFAELAVMVDFGPEKGNASMLVDEHIEKAPPGPWDIYMNRAGFPLPLMTIFRLFTSALVVMYMLGEKKRGPCKRCFERDVRVG